MAALNAAHQQKLDRSSRAASAAGLAAKRWRQLMSSSIE
jgi:hypothetical protein